MLLLFVQISNAQVGIGTIEPNDSSILDLTTTDKGFLVPRMTTAQRDLIAAPAISLMIFNTDQGDFNSYNGTILGWQDFSTASKSVTATGEIATNATTDIAVPDMTVFPVMSGSYLVAFNSQYYNTPTYTTTSVTTGTVGSAQAALDLEAAYQTLHAMPTTRPTHIDAMGTGETLFSGVYAFGGAASIAGTLYLDAQDDPNAIFVFKIGGAFACGAITNVVLINGAKASNVFWVSEGPASVGASSTMVGTMISHAAAAAIAATCTFEGRLLTLSGAITFGPAIAIIPSGVSPINLGAAANFALFTSSGDIANTASSTITGDIGTNSGTVTGLETSTHNGKIYLPSTPPTLGTTITTTTATPNNNPSVAEFSIYQNGNLNASSTKALTCNGSVLNLSLQAIATVGAGQPIEVRWKTNSEKISLGNRTLIIIKVK